MWGTLNFPSVTREGKFYVVSQLAQNLPSISKSMLHSMEGRFYVGSLEAHKISPHYGGETLCRVFGST